MRYQIRIGTSGWNYAHWQGVFYPADLPKKQWLEFYAGQFDTVELNASFYHLPKEITCANWRQRTPEHFLWAVKASRYITHIKRLRDIREPLDKFYTAVAPLKEKLGPVLFQLPPGLLFDADLFKAFSNSLAAGYRYAFEVRNSTWINNTFFEILKDYNYAFCISDTAGRFPSYEIVTADFVYLRLHGSKRLYASCYTAEELRTWALKIKQWACDAYVYFDNDYKGYAVSNALHLKDILAS